ncbi:hypothetical protein [Clostridium transplantifaecale]|uniref:hypothetical protein n=1 Tax=Clostridium transplantifaecale TaxID=2479838 RepID=UPI000F62D3C0|nr:hypothetical protein [Clostridium transplantifaecale]
MQDFSYERLRAQEAALEPYILYRKDQAVQAERSGRIRDFEYFKSMFPDRVKTLQMYVEEVCDEMEYDGSPIYDEFPDRILMEQMIQKIADRASATGQETQQAEMPSEELEPPQTRTADTAPRVSYGPVNSEYGGGEGYETWEMEETQIQEIGTERRPWGPPPPPPRPWGPPPGPGPWGPPPPPPRPWGPPPPPPRPWGPPPPPPGPWGPPPRPRNNFLNDILGILLFNELQGRRCRKGRCR